MRHAYPSLLIVPLLIGIALAGLSVTALAQDTLSPGDGGGTAGVAERADQAFDDLEETIHGDDVADGNGTRHEVREGETLAEISKRYYDTYALWWWIAEANGIDDPRDVRAGQVLLIPPQPEEPGSDDDADTDAGDAGDVVAEGDNGDVDDVDDGDYRDDGDSFLVYHTVREGETLGSISRYHYGTRKFWRMIAEANGIRPNGWIHIGQVLLIPSLDTGKPPVEGDAEIPEYQADRPALPGYFGGEADDSDEPYIPDDGEDVIPPHQRIDPNHPRAGQIEPMFQDDEDWLDEVDSGPEEWGYATFGVRFANRPTFWNREYGYDHLGLFVDTEFLITPMASEYRHYDWDYIPDAALFFTTRIEVDADLPEWELGRIGVHVGVHAVLDRLEIFWEGALILYPDEAVDPLLPDEEELLGTLEARIRLPSLEAMAWSGVTVQTRHVWSGSGSGGFPFMRWWNLEYAGWYFSFVPFAHRPARFAEWAWMLLPESVQFHLVADDPNWGSGWTDVEITWGFNIGFGGTSTLAPYQKEWVARFELTWVIDLGPSDDALRWAIVLAYTAF